MPKISKNGSDIPKPQPKVSRTKKTVNRKVPEKVSEIKKAAKQKALEKVSETVVFWCNDGQVFRDMKDLMDGLDRMSDQTFAYHLNDIKNDFSCWVLDIIGDQKLAQDLKTVKNRKQARETVQQRYIELTQLEG